MARRKKFILVSVVVAVVMLVVGSIGGAVSSLPVFESTAPNIFFPFRGQNANL